MPTACLRMDREAARRDERVLAEAVVQIVRFFEGVGDRLPLFDPFKTDVGVSYGELIDEVRAALGDRLGRGDAAREAAGHPPQGPGRRRTPKVDGLLAVFAKRRTSWAAATRRGHNRRSAWPDQA
jgi:hypothetical protein